MRRTRDNSSTDTRLGPTNNWIARFPNRVGLLILVVLAAIAYLLISGSVNQKQTNRQFKTVEFALCHRLNVLRTADNVSQRADYEFFTLTARLIAQPPAIPEPPNVRREQLRFGHRLITYAKQKEWIPLTNCTLAIEHPSRFHQPVAIPFAVQLPPPEALRVGPNE